MKVLDISDDVLQDMRQAVSKPDEDLVILGMITGRWNYAKGYQTAFHVVRKADLEGDPVIQHEDGVDIYFSSDDAAKFQDAMLSKTDYGLRLNYSKQKRSLYMDRDTMMYGDPLAVRVQALINQQINPRIAIDGGYISMVDYDNGVLSLEMGGGCQGCSLASITLREGIENYLFDNLPELEDIIDITDHEAGLNPTY